jgi:hypothetical protein
MSDEFRGRESGLTSPAQDAEAVTPSDATALPRVARGIYVGSTGNLRVRMVSGTDVTFAAVPAGTLLPLRATHVLATGTTAGGIVALR